MSETRQKIAVLGGGPSVMSALYWLTSTQELRDRYDITVYQMGWRLGGKGASGRGKDGRILEHGLHVLFGFYQNFFYMIRHAYAELNRPEGHPLRTWRQAFHPRDFGVEEEYVEGAWYPWKIAFPANYAVPGSNGALLSLPQYLIMGLQAFVWVFFGWRAGYGLTQRLFPRGKDWETAKDPPISGEETRGAMLLFRVVMGLMVFATHVVQFLKKYLPWILSIYRGLRSVLWPFVKFLAKVSRRSHRIWLDVDALLALFSGTLSDGLLLEGGFDTIDDLDFREWLLKHGMHPETESTTLVRTIYDSAFSYENGEPNKQRVSAGSTVKINARWAATYKGAAYFRMQAGMGDTVFTPLYQVLKRRGVKFEFFHKVKSLHLSEDKKRVARMCVNQQVELVDASKEYQPLDTIKGLECWPAEPLYEQIKDADSIKDVDLESYYGREVGRDIDLEVGRDFDQVLFGIPIAAVQYLCKELCDNPATPQWAAMTGNVKSVQTVAAQLWFKKSLNDMGWKGPEPLLSLFVEPYNTWADMSQVLDKEDWPAGHVPRDVGYFTGAQPGPTDPPPPGECDFEKDMKQDAFDSFVTFLKGTAKNPKRDPAIGGLTTMLPRTVNPLDPPVFDWNQLVDTGNGIGEDRLKSQYWRSNCGPSERCTLALPNTNQYRMKAGETGYENLVITGDWIDNNLYMAFMEGAFQSGILSARAISGEQFPIIGEWLNTL